MPDRGRFSRGDFSLCVACADLFQEGPDPALLQLCGCRRRRPDEQATWPRFDFNELAILCRLCAGELVESGSKWSVFFCDICHPKVVGLNKAVGGTLVPIGCHSLQNQLALRLRHVAAEVRGEPEAEDWIDRFMRGLFQLKEMIDHLEEWHRAAVRSNLEAMGLGGRDVVVLSDYLEQLPEVRRKVPEFAEDAMFGRLCGHFGADVHGRPIGARNRGS